MADRGGHEFTDLPLPDQIVVEFNQLRFNLERLIDGQPQLELFVELNAQVL
jgi:hypothetical protein